MRKLVKKLALVLALVLAFACFAPASAQAAEARRSWNFAVGEFKPTYEMEVGDTFTFEALDNGDAIDASKYTVAYYSKNADALALNKETGEAEALAAAEDVKIAAVVTNMVTGNFVKIWAFVDIAAKEVVEPEVTPTEEITPTVEVTPEPTPTEVALAAVSTRQVSKDTFAVTFNKDLEANDAAKAATKVKLTQKNSTIKYSTVVKSASVAGNELVVTLYNAPANDQTVYITYNNLEAPAHVVAVGKDVASAEIKTSEVLFNTFADIKATLYDANGVILYDGALSGYDGVSVVIPEETFDAFIVGLNQIYFSEANKAAVINIKRGDVVVGASEILSVETTVNNATSYEIFAVAASGTANKLDDVKKLAFVTPDGENISICVGDSGMKLFSKRTNVTETLGKEEKVDEFSHLQAYTYESSDTSVLLVNKSDAVLIPIKAGTADIIIKNSDGNVIGACTIKVDPARYLKRVVASLDKTTVSNGVDANDVVSAKITAYDQYDAVYKLSTADVTFEFAANKSIAESSRSVDKGIVTIKFAGKSVAKDAYTVTFKAKDVKSNAVTFAVAEPGDDSLKYELSGTKNFTAEIDGDPSKLDVTVKSYGKAGVLLNSAVAINQLTKAQLEDPSGLTDKALYVYVETISGDKLEDVTYGAKKVTCNFLTSDKEITSGTYKITLYQCTKLGETDGKDVNKLIPKDYKTFTVSDGKPVLSVEAGKGTVDASYKAVTGSSINADAGITSAVSGGAFDNKLVEELFGALKLYIGKVEDGKELKASALTSITIKGYTDGSSTIVVSEVTVVVDKATYVCTIAAEKRPVIKFAE